MLQFQPGIRVQVFHRETAMMLHHAAAWADIAGTTVTVRRIGDGSEDAIAQRDTELAVAHDSDRDRVRVHGSLASYLLSHLEVDHRVDVNADRVLVQWTPRPQR